MSPTTKRFILKLFSAMKLFNTRHDFLEHRIAGLEEDARKRNEEEEVPK